MFMSHASLLIRETFLNLASGLAAGVQSLRGPACSAVIGGEVGGVEEARHGGYTGCIGGG